MASPAPAARTVYDFRRLWLDRLIRDEFGNKVEAFAEAANRNPKHTGAMRNGSKRMGSSVARDIEAHLMKRRGSRVWPGMMDSDPDTLPARVEDSGAGKYVQAGPDSPLSQSVSEDALTMAIQLVLEVLQERRGTLPPAKQARFTKLVFDMAQSGVPKAQILPLLREAIPAAVEPATDEPTREHHRATRAAARD